MGRKILSKEGQKVQPKITNHKICKVNKSPLGFRQSTRSQYSVLLPALILWIGEKRPFTIEMSSDQIVRRSFWLFPLCCFTVPRLPLNWYTIIVYSKSLHKTQNKKVQRNTYASFDFWQSKHFSLISQYSIRAGRKKLGITLDKGALPAMVIKQYILTEYCYLVNLAETIRIQSKAINLSLDAHFVRGVILCYRCLKLNHPLTHCFYFSHRTIFVELENINIFCNIHYRTKIAYILKCWNILQ